MAPLDAYFTDFGSYFAANAEQRGAPRFSGERRDSYAETDYSFTPPTATPAMMYLDRQKYTISSGSAVSVRPR